MNKINFKLLAIVASIGSVSALQAAQNVNNPAIDAANNLQEQVLSNVNLNENELNCFNSIKFWQNPNNLPADQQNNNNTNCLPNGTAITVVFDKYKECIWDIIYLQHALSKNNPTVQPNKINEILSNNNITLNNDRVEQMSNLLQNSTDEKIKDIKIILFNIMKKLHYQIDKYCKNLYNGIQSNGQNAQYNDQDKYLLEEFVETYSPVIPSMAYFLLIMNENTSIKNLSIATKLLDPINALNNNNLFKNFIQNKVVEPEQNNNNNTADNANQLIA